MTPLVKCFYKLVHDAAHSTWFDVGEIPHGAVTHIDPEKITHLPYPDITLVGYDKGTPFCLYALSSSPGTVALAGFALLPEFQELPLLALAADLDNTSAPLKVWRKDKQPVDQRSRAMVATLQHLLATLDHGPRTAYRAEPVNTFTNRRKIAAGKPPTVSWRTITIQPTTSTPPASRPAVPTTHASPRLHTRRGHWRNLQSGKKIWVRDCQVGDASKGQVLHDYYIQSIT